MKQYTILQLSSMKIGEQRQILKALNKEARLRASRLIKAGYTGEMTQPPIMDYQRTHRDYLIHSIEELQSYTRDPRSRVSGMRKFIRGTLNTLNNHGYTFVNQDNLADFGRFMNMVRDIHGAKSFPSNEVAQMYKQMERLGVSPNVIKTKFGEFLSSQSGLMDLQLTLDTMRLPEGRKRVTSTEVYSQMKELGFI